MVSNWNLSNCKSLQISRTLLSNLADLKMILSVRSRFFLWFSISPASFFKFLRTLSSASTTIDHCHLHVLLLFQLSGKIQVFVFCFRFLFFFILLFVGTVKYTKWHLLFFLLIHTKYSLFGGSEWSFCISKSQRILRVSFVWTDYHLLIRFFHISVSWWFFTGVWVTASLLKSPGFFSVFWPFSIML